jgi:hypothetical protein
MKSRGASFLLLLLGVICTVFVVFALVTKSDKGKTRLKPDDATKQAATSNKRPKTVLQGQKGIAGFFSASLDTHANTAQGSSPYYAPVRNKEKAFHTPVLLERSTYSLHVHFTKTLLTCKMRAPLLILGMPNAVAKCLCPMENALYALKKGR